MRIIRILAALGTLALSLFLFGAAGVPFVFAQSSGDFVLISQGQLASTSPSYANSADYFDVRIGTGYTGTTTGAYVSANYVNPIGGDPVWYLLTLTAWTDSSYTTQVSSCTYGTGALPTGTYTTGSFIPLSVYGCADPTLYPQYYYSVQVASEAGVVGRPAIQFAGIDLLQNPTDFSSKGWTVDHYSSQAPQFFPQFAIVADGFQITPTASSSGLFLSGALTYCASAFGSSSAPALVADTGVALCDVGGYLFVPTPDSIQQFGNFIPQLQTKIPFSYAYSLVSLYGSLTASSTSNLPAFSILWPDFASSSPFAAIIPSSIPIMSTTTISTYYPDPIRTTFLFLGTCAIWVEALLVCYRRIVPHKVL